MSTWHSAAERPGPRSQVSCRRLRGFGKLRCKLDGRWLASVGMTEANKSPFYLMSVKLVAASIARDIIKISTRAFVFPATRAGLLSFVGDEEADKTGQPHYAPTTRARNPMRLYIGLSVFCTTRAVANMPIRRLSIFISGRISGSFTAPQLLKKKKRKKKKKSPRQVLL